MTGNSYDEPDLEEWRRLRQAQIDLRMAIRRAGDEGQRAALRHQLVVTREAIAEIEFHAGMAADPQAVPQPPTRPRPATVALVGDNGGADRTEDADGEGDGADEHDINALLESLLHDDPDFRRHPRAPGETVQQLMWGLVVVAALAVMAYILSLLVVERPESGYITLWDGWVYHVAILVPAALAALRALTDRRGRWAWWLVTVGILLYAGGNLLYTYHDQNLDPIPFPAWSDVPYLESSLAFILAMGVVTQLRVTGVSRASRLNGLVIGLAAASLAVALWFDTILEQSGSTSAVLVGLAYPLSDLVFIVILLSGLSLVGYRPSPSGLAFIVGAALWAVGDIVFLRQVAADTYVPGSILEATWVVGILLFGLAPWLPQHRLDRPPTAASVGTAFVPWAAALVALAVIGWSVTNEIPALAVWLAMAAIVTVMVRVALSVSELRKANEAFSQAWLGELAGFRDRPQLQPAGVSVAPPPTQLASESAWLITFGAIAVAALLGMGAMLWRVTSTSQDQPVEAALSATTVDTTPSTIGVTTVVTPEDTTTTGLSATELRVAALQRELDRLLSFTPLVFDSAQQDLSDNNRRVLNNVAALLLSSPGVPVKVVGYTDDSGSVETNLKVSTSRASAARDYLVSQGVADGDLSVEGRGKADASGVADLSGLERRVVFEVVAPPAAAPTVTEIRLGIVASSASNDLAFTQSMVDSANRLTTERTGMQVTVVDNTILVEDEVAAIRDLIAQGHNLIVAHDPQLGAVLPAIAEEFPDVTFAWGPTGQAPPRPNIYTYTVAAEQGGYVLGALAAEVSAGQVLGVVGPIAAGDSQRYIAGFEAGAKAARPGITVHVDYTGSFLDASLAAETATAQLGTGADVFTGSGPASTGAAAVATRNGAQWIGNQVDQSSLDPSLVVASQVYHWDVVLEQIMADIDGGSRQGRPVTGDLNNGGLSISFNPAHPVDPAVTQRLDELIGAIKGGSITPPAS